MNAVPSGDPFRDLLKKAASGAHLSRAESARAFQILLHGGATPAQMAALLTALSIKGQTAEEIAGAAEAMRARMVTIITPGGAIDSCGTGGDGLHTLNVSTAVALVVAGCGVPVAKHGNRSVSSRSGSADVLQELNVALRLSPEGATTVLAEAGIVFLMAGNFHPDLRHAAPIRRELGFPTVLNLLGPLCNPGRVRRQLLGVSRQELLLPMAEALQMLGADYAWVVHGGDGSDELSLNAPSHVIEVMPESLHHFEISAADAGLAIPEETSITGGDAKHNAHALMELLTGTHGAYRQTVLLNAAAALIVAGKVSTLQEGVALATEAIDNRRAKQALADLIRLSQAHALPEPTGVFG